jgi:hypothetical protein
MTREGGDREEVDLSAPGKREEIASPPADPPTEIPSALPKTNPLAQDAAPADPPPLAADRDPLPPGRSPLDGRLETLAAGLEAEDPRPAPPPDFPEIPEPPDDEGDR